LIKKKHQQKAVLF